MLWILLATKNYLTLEIVKEKTNIILIINYPRIVLKIVNIGCMLKKNYIKFKKIKSISWPLHAKKQVFNIVVYIPKMVHLFQLYTYALRQLILY